MEALGTLSLGVVFIAGGVVWWIVGAAAAVESSTSIMPRKPWLMRWAIGRSARDEPDLNEERREQRLESWAQTNARILRFTEYQFARWGGSMGLFAAGGWLIGYGVSLE